MIRFSAARRAQCLEKSSMPSSQSLSSFLLLELRRMNNLCVKQSQMDGNTLMPSMQIID